TTGPASNKLPPSSEASYDENDPRLMAARQAALQRLNARTAAKASATLIRLQNPDRGRASDLKRLAGQTSAALKMPEFPQIPGAVEDLLQANDQKAKASYLNRKSDEPIYLNHALVKPASPYQVMAGNIIPSSLITGLNSDLPGFLIAQVRHNVYDSVTGRHLLIPQGTRILGEYSSSVTYGQNRALVVWNRLIYPNGRSILLDGMPGVDLSGASGFKDKVDRHFWQLMGSAILGSLVATGADAAKGDDPNSILNNALSGTATTADQTIQQIIKKQLNVQPTIEIRPGYRFNIVVLADMILGPYDPQPATAAHAR
ncbi:TrbI/VirB10 family protein, partial [Paremcibacter congregatus]|uniref:TrbI/VirB10 family protein n=1 Tax=Paremcibacter congregatus TaxID=2043170 RepID=UPI003A92C388